MRKFLLHLGCFSLFIILLLAGITAITDAGLHRSTYSWYRDWNAAQNGTINADILIMGNSHAHLGVDPAVVDTSLRANSYNLGMDGYMFDVEHARYQLYQQHNEPPALIIQCMDYYVLGRATRLIDEAQFLPYIANKGLDTTLQHMGLPSYLGYLPFLKYQNFPGLVAKGTAGLLGMGTYPALSYKGFYGQPLTWDTAAFNRFMAGDAKYLAPEVHALVLAQFTSFLDSCYRAGIPVVMVFTPHYYRFSAAVHYRGPYMAFISNIAAQHHASFIDFSADTMCYNRRYFANGTHLNKEGAILFSQKLCNALKTKGLQPHRVP